MYKSILAISEGGPEAAISFRLAHRIASMFGGTVDAVHYSETHPGDADIAGQAMPFMKRVADDRLNARARESERAYKELLAPLAGATFTGGHAVTRDQLVRMGRFANLVLVGRPSLDAENIAPETVKAAIYDCAGPVVVAPPNLNSQGEGGFSSVLVAWNGSAQAARAAGFALPFLAKAAKVTILVADASPDELGTPFLLRTLGRHGVNATVEKVDHGDITGRARGRALLEYTKDKGADLLVMGAYGHGGLTNFLGLGGATAKVIASCPVPLLLAH